MNRRLNISLPERTVRLLDRTVAKGERSKFIDRAVRHALAQTTKAQLREQLEQGYAANRDEDRELANEWDVLSAEVWASLDHDEKR